MKYDKKNNINNYLNKNLEEFKLKRNKAKKEIDKSNIIIADLENSLNNLVGTIDENYAMFSPNESINLKVRDKIKKDLEAEQENIRKNQQLYDNCTNEINIINDILIYIRNLENDLERYRKYVNKNIKNI